MAKVLDNIKNLINLQSFSKCIAIYHSKLLETIAK